MTPLSIAIALVATLLVGLAGGWQFRDQPTGRLWAFAASAATGLLLFQASNSSDLFENLVPASALGWVPWLALCVVGVQAIAHDRLRATLAFALGFAIPLRLLWGSVYLTEANLELPVLVAIAVWGLAIGSAIAMKDPAPKGRINIHVFGWALLIAVTTLAIVVSGSITYAAATGVIGVAVVGNLLGASRLPLQGAAIVICIIGLSVAYSEMPLGLGMLLITSVLVVSYKSQEGASAANWSKSVHVAAMAPIVGVAVITMSKFLTPVGEYGGYGSVDSSVADVVDAVHHESLTDDSIPPPVNSMKQEPMPGPFSGFEP